jgi:peptidyl-prolyl cis-trans isomerase A (cyclophilin A)
MRLISLGFALCVLHVAAAAFAADTPPATQPAASKPASTQPATKPSNKVVIDTNKGKIVIELTPDRTPITVKNFLRYVDEKFYNGTIFHRVIAGFMIQGGGFTVDLKEKKTHDPIKNESKGGLPNNRGTISMARRPDADSATSQFFINLNDNAPLNYPSNGGGYTVFGKVVEGMDVVDKIAAEQTRPGNVSEAEPLETIKIISITRK